jgi:hypothetical protein
MSRGNREIRAAARTLSALAVIAAALLAPAHALAGSWSAVTGPTSIIQEVGQVRASDGTLHVVFTRPTPGSGAATDDVVAVSIGATGTVGSPTVIASGFAAAGNPAVVNLPGGGLEAFFGGIQCTSATCPEGLFSSISADGGHTWSAPVSVLDRDEVYASDVNAATLSDGTPFESWWHTTGTTVHLGTNSATPDYDFQGALGAGCCGYYSTLAADAAGDLRLAWSSNATGFSGVWSQTVDSATGAPSGAATRMPGSVTSYGAVPSFAMMNSRTPIVALPGHPGQFFIAYPAGYPVTDRVLLWPVGSAGTTAIVDEPQDHNAVSLAADSDGRLWVFYTRTANNGNPDVIGRRVSAAGLEPPVDLGAPPGAAAIYALDGTVSPAGDPQVLALTGLANGAAGTYFLQGPQAAPPPPPVLGKSVDVAPVSGTVLVKLPASSVPYGFSNNELTKGAGFVALTQARQLPTGTMIDARAGTLALTSATGHVGKTYSGTFSGAIFSISQDRSGLTKGLTTLALVEAAFAGAPSRAVCSAKYAGDGPAAHAALSARVLQTLLATVRGRFRIRGRFSAGTVRGTKWGTVERCDGTLTIVRRGTVLVDDFGLRKTIAVHAGQRYLARAFTRRG